MDEKYKTVIILLLSFLVISYIISTFFFDTFSPATDVAIVYIRGEITVDRQSGLKSDYASSSPFFSQFPQNDLKPSTISSTLGSRPTSR